METSEIEKLLVAYDGKLRSYARTLTMSSDNINDLMQDTALRALRNASQFDGRNFLCWTKAIMHNTFVNDQKREELCHAYGDGFEQCPSILREPDIRGGELYCALADIYDALEALPAEYYNLMHLLIVGHKYVEISDLLGVPLGTVKTRINRSRAMLKEMLGDYLN